jgi:hypothetical protein
MYRERVAAEPGAHTNVRAVRLSVRLAGVVLALGILPLLSGLAPATRGWMT